MASEPPKIPAFRTQVVVMISKTSAKFDATLCVLWNTQRRCHNQRSIRSVHKPSQMYFPLSKSTWFVVAIDTKLNFQVSKPISFLLAMADAYFASFTNCHEFRGYLQVATPNSTRLYVLIHMKRKSHVTKTIFLFGRRCVFRFVHKSCQRHNRRSIHSVHKLSRMYFPTSKLIQFVVTIDIKRKL